MKKLTTIILITIMANLFGAALSASPNNPLAKPQAVVVSNNARFTVLTPGLVRLEWSQNAQFEDHASLTFINRRTDTPQYTTTEKDGLLEIQTKKLTLHYKKNSGQFTKENLWIDIHTDKIQTTWHFGDKDPQNLLGTTKTLDKCNGSWQAHDKKEIELCQGIISPSGWCAIDDSEKPLFDNSDWPWVIARPETQMQDTYFFAYGHDYQTALKDFTTVAGKIALPPKFVFGAWWSKYWTYDDDQLRDLARQFDRYDLGLDVMVIDMDWHITSDPKWYDSKGKKIKDPADQRAGWTGFTWNKNYFPDPQKFLQWTNENSLQTCLNLHPASGIQPHESQYNQFAQALGIDPATKKFVPFDIVNKEFATAYMDILLKPMEDHGIDFWWLDWQQWSTTTIKGVNPVFYLNYVHHSSMERRGKRPLIFHRWGGLGNHRYQIGFSGDTVISWKSLAYQPYFTTNAANVGFGFWSHDIGGHYNRYGLGVDCDPELYTRWIQWGILSPVFRTHATRFKEHERRPWAYPMEYFQAMRKAYDLRYELLPYIYTAARQAYDTGISLCRPLYYNWPQAQEAYTSPNQYMFGNDLLVNPIVAPIEEGKKYTIQKTWLPQGTWYEYTTGQIFHGPQIIERPFMIDEIPIYVKAGTILPTAPEMKRVDQKPLNPLILDIYPGTTGSTTIYEDAGNDLQYKNNAFTFTDVNFTKQNNKLQITISPVRGSYPQMLNERACQIKLINTLPPKAIQVDNSDLSFNEKNIANSWNYQGSELTTIINIPAQSTHQPVNINIELNDNNIDQIAGIKGKLKRLRDFVAFAGRPEEPMYEFEPVIKTSLAGRRMTYQPTQAETEMQNFNQNYKNALKIIENKISDNPEWQTYLELLNTDPNPKVW